MSKRLVRTVRAMIGIEPYKVSGKKSLFMKQSENPLKLNWNESTISFSQKAAEGIFEAANQTAFKGIRRQQ